MIIFPAILVFTLILATVEAEKDAIRSEILNNVESGLSGEGKTELPLPSDS